VGLVHGQPGVLARAIGERTDLFDQAFAQIREIGLGEEIANAFVGLDLDQDGIDRALDAKSVC